jgi:hypothetical protein
MSMDDMDHAALDAQLRRESLTECAECGWDFNDGKLLRRRAKGLDVCISCAIDLNLELDVEDSHDVAEHQGSSRADSHDGGNYYSSERMDAARRIGH